MSPDFSQNAAPEPLPPPPPDRTRRQGHKTQIWHFSKSFLSITKSVFLLFNADDLWIHTVIISNVSTYFWLIAKSGETKTIGSSTGKIWKYHGQMDRLKCILRKLLLLVSHLSMVNEHFPNLNLPTSRKLESAGPVEVPIKLVSTNGRLIMHYSITPLNPITYKG